MGVALLGLLLCLQEWLWVVGYFLQAKLLFAQHNSLPVEETISSIHCVMGRHAQMLKDYPWQGLPEITNKDGAECSDSCPVQAWSMATLLDTLLDLAPLQRIDKLNRYLTCRSISIICDYIIQSFSLFT